MAYDRGPEEGARLNFWLQKYIEWLLKINYMYFKKSAISVYCENCMV